MQKLIAKTKIGAEYMHSREHSFFADRCAQKIADALNANKYNLNDGEKWYVYDSEYGQDMYTWRKIYITSKGTIKIKAI